ncbi:M1 family aminopeptidase [Proteiniborus sp. MB09-C3]|uniref:M1 family aminopeptidase n=1 Tax=Proteiniborus sp. MB09-C3 TaxID=3050072 RepID=UPI0025521F00|nr:M1 family aminopeptidase [Proteiniborus sp. MB09-C3]WIV11934.1 M1 family aminopeptidase [Proteiniborus sp. MB09-C3]
MSLLKNEIKFMLKSKGMILLIIVACIIMTIGINSLNMSNDFDLFYIKRSSSTISFGSAKFGASICSLLFGLFTVLTLDKDKRKRSKAIIESNQSYYKLMVIRILSIVFYELLVTLLGMIVVMAMQKFTYGIPINISYYLFNYFVVFFPSLLFSTLIISGLYLLTDSLDISFITLGVFFAKSLTSNNYLFTWVQTNIDIISDFAGIQPVGNTILYNRILWFFACISIFCIGLLFKRRYELNIGNSFLVNIKNRGLVLLVIAAILGSGFTYIKEPYTMELVGNFDTVIDEKVCLTGLIPKIVFNNEKGEMNGEVIYNFINKGSDLIKFNTNEGLKIDSIKANGKEMEYTADKYENIIEIPIPNTEKVEISISYGGKIKSDKNGVGRGMPGYISKDSIYLLENSNWIFRPLVKDGDSIRISGYYSAPDYLTMVVPGILTDVETIDGMKKWMFEYESHTSDIGAFAGKYKKSQIAFENMNVEFYYSPRHEEYVENMKIEEHIKDIMKYYTENIGQYYSDIYPLKIAEVALYKRGGHSSENVITISENMLNRDKSMYSLIESENIQYMGLSMDVLMTDISIIAHEMAHQWWGTGVDVVEDSPWSCEGLAQYSSYKYIQSKFGDMESKVFLSRWESRVRELKNYYYINNSEMLDKVNEKYRRSLEMEKLQSELYYLMPIKLLRAEEALGEEEFLKGLGKVYNSYLLRNLTFDEFLKEMNISEEAMEIE